MARGNQAAEHGNIANEPTSHKETNNLSEQC
jgi:hypothetical protein